MNECTRAVVLAAGAGTRMRRDVGGPGLNEEQRSAAAGGLKGMIPDARGRPFLDHVLSALADGGVVEVCLVVGSHDGPIRDHFELRPPRRTSLAFAVQPTPRGTADAVLHARDWIGARDVLVLNADNLYPPAAIGALVQLGAAGLVAFDRETLIRESNFDAARIRAFATLELRADDTLAAIVEKPATDDASISASPWISMNLWRCDAALLDACRDVTPSPRGELELPLAVGLAIQRGDRLQAVRLAAGVLDLSSRSDIVDVARRLGDRDILP
ncbi:MAG: sugar phosphate nucleotidyltransferase [Gemmatimonadales bacterium]